MSIFGEDILRARLARAKARMRAAGIDVLIVPAPENMNYLAGLDGWSFYLDQGLIMALERDQLLWFGRGSDVAEARSSPVLAALDVHPYGEEYLQSTALHPYDFVADLLQRNGLDVGVLALSHDAYPVSPRAYLTLARRLPNVRLVDDDSLLNWLRLVKEPGEIACMRRAGEIAAIVLGRAVETIMPGARRCDTAAAVLAAQAAPSSTTSGDYPAIAPLLIRADGPAIPHSTWSDDVYGTGSSVVVEIAGCYRRYHCPIARTVSLREPDPERADAARAVAATLDAVRDFAAAGVTCEEVGHLCRDVLRRHGVEKRGRFGYSTGIGYPPDWGEHTVSVRDGDHTRLAAGMTLFLIPGLWGESWSMVAGETFLIGDDGATPLTEVPFDLIVKAA